jgi:hypothetical protein
MICRWQQESLEAPTIANRYQPMNTHGKVSHSAGVLVA